MTLASRVLSISAIAVLGAILAYLLWMMGAGLEWTDEGLSLNLMRHPWLYGTSTSQAGLIYAPLHDLAGGNIWGLRALNTCLTCGLFGALSYLAIPRQDDSPNGRWSHAVLCAAGALSGLFYLRLWLPSPNYNSLTLQTLAALMIAVILARRLSARSSRHALLAWVIAGIVLGLVFQAKPTSAAVAGLAVIPCALSLPGLRIRALGASMLGTVACILGFALLLDGTPMAYVAGLRASLDLSTSLKAGYSLTKMLEIPAIYLPNWMWTGAIGVICVSAIPLVGAGAGQAMMYGAFGLAALTFANIFERNLVFIVDYAGLIGAIALFVFAVVLAVHLVLRKTLWSPVDIALVAMPLAFWFGSNNTFWHMTGSAAGFWVVLALRLSSALAPLVGAGPRSVVAGLSLIMLSDVLDRAIDVPYRQDIDLRQMRQRLPAAPSLRGSQQSAEYTARLADAFSRAGHRPDDPVIDLTGRNPTSLYLVQATPLGAPWLLGGYAGSPDFADLALRRFSCDLIVDAFVLQEIGGPRELPESVLARFGLALSDHYAPPVTFASVQGDTELRLFAPAGANRDDALAACRARELPGG